jgi:hypothetical protein
MGPLTRKSGKKPIASAAREAVQMAEDARIITIKKMEEARLMSERQASDDREARSKADAESAAKGRLQAEARERTEAEARLRAEGERANAQSGRLSALSGKPMRRELPRRLKPTA